MEIGKSELITGIFVKIFSVWFIPISSPINGRECDADWQWLRNLSNNCQMALHCLLFIGNLLEKTKREILLQKF